MKAVFCGGIIALGVATMMFSGNIFSYAEMIVSFAVLTPVVTLCGAKSGILEF